MTVNNHQVVSVFAPISIGNVSIGFDILGLAVSPVDGTLIGDIVHVSAAQNTRSDNILEVKGSHADRLPAEVEDNIVWKCLLAFNHELKKNKLIPQKLHLILEKNIPTSSGLGSSACSVVATIFALNEFYDKPFDKRKLLKLMVALEAMISGSVHYDNVAPCYLGGLQLIVDNAEKIAQQLPVFEDCYWVMAYPDVLVSTKAARDILPKNYDRQTTIQYGRNLATFIDASHRKDKQQAFALFDDVIAEPFRKHLLPNYTEATKRLQSYGCLAVGISGSGPTLFAVTDDLDIAKQSQQWLLKNYIQTRDGFVALCKADLQGTRRI